MRSKDQRMLFVVVEINVHWQIEGHKYYGIKANKVI